LPNTLTATDHFMARRHSQKSTRITLTQVAAKAGVSVTTASLVLCGKAKKHRISDETVQKVNATAEELDYSPNLLVHSLQRGSTGVISFYNSFGNRHFGDQYMDRLTTAMEYAAGKLQYDILTHCHFDRTPKQTYRFLNGGRADGLLLFAPQPDDPILPMLRKSRLPVVLVNVEDKEGLLSSVRDDVRGGMAMVSKAILDHGHQRVGVIVSDPVGNPDSVLRVSILRDHLVKAGLGIAPEDYLEIKGAYQVAEVEAFVSRRDRPTAIFCWHDRLAYTVLEICDRIGISVPDELSIIGYDGIPWHAATKHTPASAKVDFDGLAEASIRILDNIIRGKQTEPARIELPVQFQEGTTLGKAVSLRR